ncbi:hypothetical protein BDR04DRAFT_1162941 [Suillus decipiens]|nr:hypothetical protein BDR04DRAFT_1162941 [Suillus decipiens]
MSTRGGGVQNHTTQGYSRRAIFSTKPSSCIPPASFHSQTFEVNMSDKLRTDGSASTRGILQVSLKKATPEPIFFNDRKQTKQTAQALTAINVLQLIVHQGPNVKHPNNARAFFTKDASIQSLSGGVFAPRVLMNIDVSTGVLIASRNAALAVLKQRDARVLDLRAKLPQFQQLKSFFKGISVMLVHRGLLSVIDVFCEWVGDTCCETTPSSPESSVHSRSPSSSFHVRSLRMIIISHLLAHPLLQLCVRPLRCPPASVPSSSKRRNGRDKMQGLAPVYLS